MHKPRTAKAAVNLWLIDRTRALGLKPRDIALRLDVSESTVRGWEAGRAIGPDSIARLEDVFGEPAPDSVPAMVADQAALVAALMELAAEIRLERQARQGWEREVVSGLAELLRAGTAAGPSSDPSPAPRAESGQ